MTQSLEKIMEEVEINVDGLTDEIKSYELTPEQYKWFLLQASKVQELEEEIKTHAPEGRNYSNAQYVQLLQENKQLKEKLDYISTHLLVTNTNTYHLENSLRQLEHLKKGESNDID